MTIAPAQPARSGNPGIVPPWLQGGSRPVTPRPGTPAPAPRPEQSAAAAHASAGRDALMYIPVPGGVVVVDLPGAGAQPRRRAGDQRMGEVVAREQQRLDATVSEIQQRFSELGIRDDEGNDRVVARFNPRYPNASYAPNGIPENGVPADSITVGMDPRSMTPFSRAKDVVAHELAHRVIDHMTGGEMDLSPFSEDVAVHESLADTFAALVDDDDWVIGDQLAEPIRVMDAPEQLGHPDHVDDLGRVLAPGSEFMHQLPLRDGGVLRDRRTGDPVEVPDWHVVAGIPNKAATIIGDGLGRAKLGQIYLRAVREHLRPGTEVEGLASAVLQSARDLYGAGSRELQVTRDAWDAVGVLELLQPQPSAAR